MKAGRPAAAPPPGDHPDLEMVRACTRRHLRFGWWSLLVFLSLGILLEALHGFKAPWYLGPAHETRRLMWTLAHAHGVLLSLVHIAFGLTQERLATTFARARALASSLLIGATVLLPGGFFLGGLMSYGGDPGLGILLVPPGALLLFAAVLLVARATGAAGAFAERD